MARKGDGQRGCVRGASLGWYPSFFISTSSSSTSIVPLPSRSNRLKMPCSSSTISVFDAARCRVTGATRCGDIGGIEPVDPSLRSISSAVTLDACAASIGGSCFETSFAFVVAPAPSRAFMISSTCHISTHL